MPLRWRKRPQRPPSPFVEDEFDSLSREFNGSSYLGEKPGVEGVKARGTVNQCPVILDVERLIVSNSSNVEEKPAPGSRSSGPQTEPPTPETDVKLEPKQNPSRHQAGERQSQGPGMHPARSPLKRQDVDPKSQPPQLAQRQEFRVQMSTPATSQRPPTRQSEFAVRGPGARVDTYPAKRVPDVPRAPTVSSRTPSVTRGKEQHKTSSTIPPQLKPIQDSGARVSTVPPKRSPDGPQGGQPVPSRTSSMTQSKEQHEPSIVRPQPEPPRESGSRMDTLPPKRMPDVAQKSQPAASRPLPAPSQAQRGPRSSTVSSKPETIAGDSGPQVDKLPPGPDVAQKSQPTSHPLPPPPETGRNKFSPSIIPPPKPPRPVSDTPQRSKAVPLRPLHNPPQEAQPKPTSSTLKRSGSVNQGPTSKPSLFDPRSSFTSGYSSDTSSIRRNYGPDYSNHSPTRQIERTSSSSPGMSVAERLEEKLKLRRELRESGDYPPGVSTQENPSQAEILSSAASTNQQRSVPQVQSQGVLRSLLASGLSSSRGEPFPTLNKATGEAKPQDHTTAPLKSALRSQSLDRSQPASTQPTRRRTVSFAEKLLEPPSQALVRVDHETALTLTSRPDDPEGSSRSSSPNSGLSLLPCPRSVPVAGYQDWYTLEGLNHLDICPSCVKQMRKSKFRDRLVLSAPKLRTEPVRCAMSEPWARLAWMQTLKKNLDDLDLLLQITRSPAGTKPCTGRIINDQYWYRIFDPETGMYLPQFNVCSACVRNIKLLMPVHRETFERSGTPQERVCDFVTDSPRFIRYIDALDLGANRAEQEDTPPDLSEFLAYARRKVVLRDCRRSRLSLDTWHYVPELPEFTVCEDCYDDVVWPLVKARYPVARQFSTVMRLLPGDEASSSREASCQLYSPRIRAKFTDAVRHDDMPFIKWMALTRYDAEQRFRDRQDELLEDQHRGYDCSNELRKNLEDWKRYE